MYKIIFYEDENGSSEVVSYIKELQKRSKKSKECRVLFNKIVAYLDMLEEQGTRKHFCDFASFHEKDTENTKKRIEKCKKKANAIQRKGDEK